MENDGFSFDLKLMKNLGYVLGFSKCEDVGTEFEVSLLNFVKSGNWKFSKNFIAAHNIN